MTSLIIGYGEVGQALHKIVGGDVYDEKTEGQFDVLHICFPFSKTFIKSVKDYQKKFEPNLTIIHSTVKLGTSRKLGAVHSPIRGVHPNLELGIRTFVKFFGGKQSKEAASIFENLGLKTECSPNQEDTEALKLWDTTQYGAMILLNKEIHKWCEENRVDFNFVYGRGNETYNEGYTKLGRQEVVRPILKYTEGKIGGHCVVPNSFLFNSEITKKLRKS